MEHNEVFDAIIIGAGAAGLAAASELRAHNRNIVVLEARSRVGGRILTYRDPDVAVPIELGAEFLHGATPNTDTVIQRAGLTAIDVAGETWQAVDGRLRRVNFWKKVDRVLRRLDEHREPDRSFDDYLAEHAARKRKPRHARARALASEFVQGFHAADMSLVSERWLGRVVQIGRQPLEQRTGRILDGYDRVPACLARDVFDAIELNTLVTSVNWERGRVIVTCRSADGFLRSFEGHTLIVTVPIGVLKAAAGEPGAIEFTPEVPGMLDAVATLEMGSAVRTVFAFSQRIWEAPLSNAHRKGHNLLELNFLQIPGSAFPVWWTQFPVRAPLLVGWVGGPPARTLSTLPNAEIERLALNDLAHHIGTTYEHLAGLVRGSWVHNWDTDPFSRGAYSYPAVGGSGAARRLSRPVEQTIFLAGEATDTSGRSGTVEGALSSGSRAAQGVLLALGTDSIPIQ